MKYDNMNLSPKDFHSIIHLTKTISNKNKMINL